ncbi:MAG TPA: methylated-DNA--[protein]-cysteine S-methyltransferase, partial [Longimicrobiaceae bacterium]|nr:methylated-DNA--[protein]-cysteine S-methyltransferase [Longimicrobiaceae bacterium]
MIESSMSQPAPSRVPHRLLLSSPVGPLLMEHDGAAVRRIRYWAQGSHPPAGTRVEPARDDALGRAVAEQLRDYFAGKRRDFDLPLAAEGTDFRRRVWETLRRIPWGETRTYGQVAGEVGSIARAVGQANRHNPIPIVIP